ncbi:hypothetical protein QQ045_020119 [Rhodiola kirilowii]
MTRDQLTAPMSTVASEACFSVGTRVLDDKRSRLNDTTIEMCICLMTGLLLKEENKTRHKLIMKLEMNKNDYSLLTIPPRNRFRLPKSRFNRPEVDYTAQAPPNTLHPPN